MNTLAKVDIPKYSSWSMKIAMIIAYPGLWLKSTGKWK
jgi:hypothetical protein